MPSNRAKQKSDRAHQYIAEHYSWAKITDSLLITAQENGLDIYIFPEICPFERIDILNPQYLPEN